LTLEENGIAHYRTPSEVDEFDVLDTKVAIVELDKMLSEEFRDELRSVSEEDVIRYHRSLGMWMRNNWQLSGSSRLARYFNELGVQHPDRMSTIILTSYWHHLNGKDPTKAATPKAVTPNITGRTIAASNTFTMVGDGL